MQLIIRYLRQHVLSVLAVMALVLARAMSELLLPRIMSIIVDSGVVNGDIPFIIRMGLLMLGINLAGMFCAFGSSFLSARVAMRVSTKLRRDLFSYVSSFSLADMNHFGASSLITRLTSDVMQIQNVTLMSLRIMLMAPFMMIGGIIMAITQDSRLSVILWAVLPVLALIVWFFARRSMPLFASIQKKNDTLNRVVRENLSGLRVIRAFNKRLYETRRFQAANQELTDTSIRVSTLMALLMPLIMLFLNSAIVLVLWFVALRVQAGSIQIWSLMAFIQYMGQILFSLLMVSMLFVMIPRASVSIKRIREVLNHQPSVRDAETDSQVTAMQQTGPEAVTLQFDQVAFRYPGAEAPALADISFSCCSGETLAVIGGTGAGKSTLLNLVLRLYDPESGSININGMDIRSFSLKELRALVALVPQKAFLFSGTIQGNISYGKPQAEAAEIQAAAEAAQLGDFLKDSSDGLQTATSRGGTTVSGGQRQRIAIARALARKAPVYLFDDCFSALDSRTEAALRQALRDWARDALVLLVTQRISSARHADRIIVLDEGRIAGIGTHEELAKHNQVYREIMGSQLDKEDDHE